ncbi:MAG: hypothetical protein QXT47_00070 [Desulfurococcaceae archaeon]
MELEYKEEYVRIIEKQVAQHTIFVGLVYAVVFSLAISVIIAIILKPTVSTLITYTILLGAIPISITSIIYSRINSKRFAEKAKEFVDLIEKLGKRFNTAKIELLEAPPPPLISIFNYDEKFLAIVYYDTMNIHVNILEPIKIKESEGYIPIYLVKKKEWLSTRKVGDRNVKTYKGEVAIPIPLKDRVIEGLFYITEIRFTNPAVEDIYGFLETILKTSN